MVRHPLLECLERREMLSITANGDTYYTSHNASLTIPAYAGVLANDIGSSLSAILVSGPNAGTLTLNSDGSFTYTNTMMAMGDSFSYKDYDGSQFSNVATVSLSFSGGQPQAAGDSFNAIHDRTFSENAPGVLANDNDPNHLHLTAVLETNPSHGSVTLNSDGSLAYTPATHYTGSDSFTYEAYNGSQYSSPATVNVSVTNQAPAAVNDSYALPNDQPFNTTAATGVLANDGDPDGDALSASLVSGPSHGTLALNADGSFTYTPDAHWVGSDSFVYSASDGVAASQATVTLVTQYSVLTAVDQTKIPVDTLQVSNQLFKVPLAYNSVAAQPDAVVEADLGLSTAYPTTDLITATLTFNGVQQPPVYYNMSTLNGSDSHIHLAMQVDTSGLATGRYAYSLVVTSPDMAAPATISGAVNVVNNSASPIGKGWDIPGMYRLFPNTASGVPAGVLLTTGDGLGWYFTQATGDAYTSPNGPYAFDTLTSVSGGGWKLLDKDGTTYNFNSAGYLTSSVLRTGATATYNWNSGLLTSIVNPFSRAVDLGYTSGLLSSVSDYAGNLWTVAHTGANLTSITEPDPGSGSPVWQYAYTGNYLSSVTDPNSNLTSFTLDSYHRVSGVSLPGGGGTSATSEQDFGYGSTNQSSPASLTLQSNVLPTSTDALGDTSSYQTDAFGDPIYQVDSYGNVTQWIRDANGLVDQLIEPPPTPGAAAPVTNFTYDALGNETSATGAHPSYGTYVFNAFSEPVSFINSNSDEWTWSYDTHGNLLQTEDPLQNVVSYTVDSFGNPLTITTPAPNNATGTVTTTLSYDPDERLTKILWPDGSSRTAGYDTDDRPTTVTDENNHTTTTHYDVLGRIVSVVNAMNGVVSATYDKDGNVLTTTDEMNNVTRDVWNARNELTTQILPDPDGAGPLASPVWQWTYDAAGDVLTETDPMNRVTSYTYDKLRRMTQETLPDPDGAGPLASPVVTIGYDNLSRKTSEQDPLGTTTWAYGNTDTSQVTSMTLPDPDGGGPLASPVWTYSYDTLGRQDVVTNPMGHSQTTSFDADGRTVSVLDNLGHGPTYGYGRMGELLTTTDSLNHTTTDQYDSRFRLVRSTDADGGVTQIQLDPAGNTTAVVDADNNKTSFVFDALNRETSETNALDFTRSFSYDASSDLTSETDMDGRVRDFVYDNLHRETTENWMSGGTVA